MTQIRDRSVTGRDGTDGAAAAGRLAAGFVHSRVISRSGPDVCGPAVGEAESAPCAHSTTDRWTPAAPMLARDLQVAGTGGVEVVLVVDGTATALRCTTNFTGRCQNTADEVVIPAGSRIEMRYLGAGGTGFDAAWRALQAPAS